MRKSAENPQPGLRQYSHHRKIPAAKNPDLNVRAKLESGLTNSLDSMGRLREYNRGTLTENGAGIETPITLAGTNRMYSWNLDSVGNWKSTTKVDTSDVETVENRTHNRLHQMINADGLDYYYDANGNMTETPTQWLTFDALNRMTAVSHKYAGTDVEFRYDAQGRRIRKTVTSEATTKTDYIYSSLQCLEERDNDDNMSRQYVWGHYVDELLQIKSADGSRFYPLQDLLYRTNALTDGYGNVVEEYDTDAYGNTLMFNSADEEIDTPTCEFIFTGRRLDPETGLYYYRARYYNPNLGRFISKDPIGYVDSMGLYEYVKSKPVVFMDAIGLQGTIGPADPNNTHETYYSKALTNIYRQLGDQTDALSKFTYFQSHNSAKSQAKKRLEEKRTRTWTEYKKNGRVFGTDNKGNLALYKYIGTIKCSYKDCSEPKEVWLDYGKYKKIEITSIKWREEYSIIPAQGSIEPKGQIGWKISYTYLIYYYRVRAVKYTQRCLEECKCSNGYPYSRRYVDITGKSDKYWGPHDGISKSKRGEYLMAGPMVLDPDQADGETL